MVLLPYLLGEIFRQDNLGSFHPPRLSTAQDDMLFFLEFIIENTGSNSLIPDFKDMAVFKHRFESNI